MVNRGVLLYADLNRLEDVPDRLGEIYDHLGEYLDTIKQYKDILHISKMADSLDMYSLDAGYQQLDAAHSRLKELQNILDTAYELYVNCNSSFVNTGQTLCNLYAETPWYETNEGKIAIGLAVLAVTVAVALVCPVVVGAVAPASSLVAGTVVTVTQSIATSAIIGSVSTAVVEGGINVIFKGESFVDGFADGFETGAITGALGGVWGAGVSTVMAGAKLAIGGVVAVNAVTAIGDGFVGTAYTVYMGKKHDKTYTGGELVHEWVDNVALSFGTSTFIDAAKSIVSHVKIKKSGTPKLMDKVDTSISETGKAERGSTKKGVSKTKNEIPEIEYPDSINVKDVTDYWDKYLGSGQTDIDPRTGKKDPNRIFSADGKRSILFGEDEMASMGTKEFYFIQEIWPDNGAAQEMDKKVYKIIIKE